MSGCAISITSATAAPGRAGAAVDEQVLQASYQGVGAARALKNAIDYLYVEWNNKAAGFVTYGSAGGTRAVEQLRLVMAELQIADVRAQVALSLFTDFENFSTMLDQVVAWSGAMRALRTKAGELQRLAA